MRRLLLVTMLLLPGCGLHQSYVEADETTYKVIEPYMSAALDRDPSIDEDFRDDYKSLLRSWKARIDRAKAYIAQGLNEE